MEIKETLEKAKGMKGTNKTYGHVGFARKELRRLKKEIGEKEYKDLGPTTAFNFVVLRMKEVNETMYNKVVSEVGLSRYKRECSRQYYTVRDE